MQFTGRSIQEWVLTVIGGVFTIILAANATGIFTRKEWGEMLMFFVGAAACGWVIYSPDSFIAFLKFLVDLVAQG